MKLRVEKREDGWWVTGHEDETTDCGPYPTKKEAEDDRQGLERFWNYENQ
jgi:hypothetical protein